MSMLRRWRTRLRQATARRVMQWAHGVEIVFPGDPRRRVIGDHTAWAPMRLVQFFPEDGDPVTVGRFSAIHHSVTIFHGGLHHLDWVSVGHFDLEDGQLVIPPERVVSNGPVVIGGDTWVGFEALIMSGVTIGHGAVVAARSVVTSSVEPYSIVGGSPARHIKYRFDEPTRAALLRIAWWDWPDDKVIEHGHEINSPDVAAFIARHDPGPA